MLKVGLTGGAGSGKSTVSEFFKQLGIEVIDADCIANFLTTPGQPAFESIVTHFGQTILDAHGRMDRKKLRTLIFSKPLEKKWLENLLHPMILREMKARTESVKSSYCVLVIPLLQEVQVSHALIDRILVIDAPIQLQLQRIQERDHVSQEEAQSLLKAQASQQERLKIADDIILNDAGRDALESKVTRLHKVYLQYAGGEYAG